MCCPRLWRRAVPHGRLLVVELVRQSRGRRPRGEVEAIANMLLLVVVRLVVVVVVVVLLVLVVLHAPA